MLGSKRKGCVCKVDIFQMRIKGEINPCDLISRGYRIFPTLKKVLLDSASADCQVA